jgi:hypothetical protein
MIVELRKSHWVLFVALALTQFVGCWMTLVRSPYGPAVWAFLTHGGWFGLFVPLTWIIGCAFATTVIVAKLTETFGKKGLQR